MPYDLLLRGATLIDPSQGVCEIRDVAVTGNQIAAVGPGIEAPARETIDLSGKLLTPGWIDLHTHVYEGVTTWGIKADALCLSTGVTTIVDAGSAGWANFLGFKDSVVDTYRTRVLAFVHLSGIGLTYGPVGEMQDLRYADPERTAFVVQRWPDVCVGIKLRMGAIPIGENGLAPLRLARVAAELVDTRLMIHISRGISVPDILRELRTGDIVTHCYTTGRSGSTPNGDGSNGLIIGPTGLVLPDVWQARRRGILFDLGHGRTSFDYAVAKRALTQGFRADVLSTDLHARSFERTVSSMPETASKLLNLGVELPEIIRQVTTAPAAAIGRSQDLGTVKAGSVADLAAFDIVEGQFEFHDGHGNCETGSRMLRPLLTVRAGTVYRPAELQEEVADARQRARQMDALIRRDFAALGGPNQTRSPRSRPTGSD
jgi:dihydroorotase